MTWDVEQRRAVLLHRCAGQRERICNEISSIEDQLGGVERGVRVVQALTTLPGLLVSGSVMAMLAMAGRGRTVQLISTGLALWGGARRLMRGRTQLAELLADSDR